MPSEKNHIWKYLHKNYLPKVVERASLIQYVEFMKEMIVLFLPQEISILAISILRPILSWGTSMSVASKKFGMTKKNGHNTRSFLRISAQGVRKLFAMVAVLVMYKP